MPNYIKKIVTRNTLTSWEHDTIYCRIQDFHSSILITYVDENEFLMGNTITGSRGGLNFFTIYPDLWSNNNLQIKKRAEAFFSSITGELIQFKIKIGKQWFTLYDLSKQIRI